MKILVTGMTDNQAIPNYYEKSRLKVIPCNYSLVKALEDMGHDVDQRIVTIGEDLKEYDDVIVFMRPPTGFAYALYNGLWAIHARPDCILAHDDWQIEMIEKALSSIKDKDRMFRDFFIENSKYIKDIPQKLENYADDFKGAIETIESGENRLLISAFDGGDVSKLFEHNNYPKDRIFRWNPNPYHLHRQPKIDVWSEEKENVFNFAGLIQGQTEKWLTAQDIDSTGWRLKKYGSKKDGQDRITEDNMMTMYAQHWGILMAGYSHAGSGWWRARPVQVADAESILIGDPVEMMIYYNDERLASVTAQDVANMTYHEKVQFAEDQKDALYKTHPLDKEVQKKELNDVLGATK